MLSTHRHAGSGVIEKAGERALLCAALYLGLCAALGCKSTAHPIYQPEAGGSAHSPPTAGRGGSPGIDPCLSPIPNIAQEENTLADLLNAAIHRQDICVERMLNRKELKFVLDLRCSARTCAIAYTNDGAPSPMTGDPCNTNPWLMTFGRTPATIPESFLVTDQETPDGAFRALQKLQGFCQKLQTSKFTSAGVGHWGDVWVLSLAADDGHP